MRRYAVPSARLNAPSIFFPSIVNRMSGFSVSTVLVFSSYFHDPLPITISLPSTTLLAVTENSFEFAVTLEKRYTLTSSWHGPFLSTQTECPRHTRAIAARTSSASVFVPAFCLARPQPPAKVSRNKHANFMSLILLPSQLGSPITFTQIFLSLGPSNSQKNTPCHLPNANSPSSTKII